MDNSNDDFTIEGETCQMLSDSMPDVLDYGDTFSVEYNVVVKPGDIVVANKNGQLIVRQLGYGTLRASTTEYKDIDLKEVHVIGKIEDLRKGDL